VEVKRPGREAGNSLPSSAEVKECVDVYLHYPNTPSWRGAQLKKAQGQLYFYLYVCMYVCTCVCVCVCVCVRARAHARVNILLIFVIFAHVVFK